MDDPFVRQPGNHLMSDTQLEELRLTTDIILQAAELVQKLESESPEEASRSYFIHDSLDAERMRIPSAITAHIDEQPEEVVITFDSDGAQSRESFNLKLIYAGIVATVNRNAALTPTEPFVIELADVVGNSFTILETSPEEVSNLIASLIYPQNTPELAQYTDPNDRANAEEIQDVLRETVCDYHTGLITYLAEDGVTEIVSGDNGEKITDIEVISTRSDDLYFSVEHGSPVHNVRKLIAKMALDPTEKGIAFFMQYGANGRGEEFMPDRSDLEKLHELLQSNMPSPPKEVSLNEEDLG